jgi:hypothetical protein
MEFNNNETYILLELLHTAINGLLEDLDHEGLSEQGATVLSEGIPTYIESSES